MTQASKTLTKWLLFHWKNYFIQRKRALCYIHPRTFYLGFPVRVGARL